MEALVDAGAKIDLQDNVSSSLLLDQNSQGSVHVPLSLAFLTAPSTAPSSSYAAIHSAERLP